MPLQGAFQYDDGTPNEPGQESPWIEWVGASKTRNYCSDDPLLDWLDAYGEIAGFARDDQRPGYDPRTDFQSFLLKKAAAFESAVVSYLANRIQVVTIRTRPQDVHERRCVETTWNAMREGVEVVAQGVLWNAQTRTFGAPDLLVRSDVLHRLFPSCISNDEACCTSDLPSLPFHYRVVDIKFTTLDILKDGQASSTLLRYMAQVWLYNDALGRLQGFTPPAAFLLGRRWKDSNGRGRSAVDRLARIDHDCFLKGYNLSLRDVSLQACDWIRRVRLHGRDWRVCPEPSIAELRPNMRNREDQPWHSAKVDIARELQDLTLLPRVTPDKRAIALSRGLSRWTDANCSAAALGITGATAPPLVDAVIRANHSAANGPVVFPPRITANQLLWREPASHEFYIDFETVTDLDDTFERFPEVAAEPMIFMVGCGQLSNSPEPQWTHHAFVAHNLSFEEERRIIEEWLGHMQQICETAGVTLSDARLFHWSPAETSFLTEAYNSAVVRHGAITWPKLPWVDLLNDVIRKQPVTVRGAFGFGLKPIARALHSHGLIATSWPEGPTDGLGAMAGAWSCHLEARRSGESMCDSDLMNQITAYNEVDCKVMAEVLAYIRRHR